MKKIFTVLFMTLILAGSASAQEKRFAMSTPKAIEGNVSKFEAGAFASELQKALTNNGYRVVARGPAVDAIIKDFDFESNSSLTDNEKAKLAQLKNVDYICMPAVMEKNGIYYFSATVIDKELGEFVAVVSAFLKNFSDIDSACEQMAGEILSYLGSSFDNNYTRSQSSNSVGNTNKGGALTGSINGHEYVDLGLPSGLLWSTCNIGASRPEEYGNYYAWGESTTRSKYDWNSYKWCRGSYNTLTKYNTNPSYGTVDNRKVLEMSDDVANVNWGGDWRMPTAEEWKELNDKCTWTWTTQGGKNGYRVTGPNGKSMFLPVAGYRSGTSVIYAGSYGYYWSSSLYSSVPNYAYLLSFYSGSVLPQYNDYRYSGFSVRPVQ